MIRGRRSVTILAFSKIWSFCGGLQFWKIKNYFSRFLSCATPSVKWVFRPMWRPCMGEILQDGENKWVFWLEIEFTLSLLYSDNFRTVIRILQYADILHGMTQQFEMMKFLPWPSHHLFTTNILRGTVYWVWLVWQILWILLTISLPICRDFNKGRVTRRWNWDGG